CIAQSEILGRSRRVRPSSSAGIQSCRQITDRARSVLVRKRQFAAAVLDIHYYTALVSSLYVAYHWIGRHRPYDLESAVRHEPDGLNGAGRAGRNDADLCEGAHRGIGPVLVRQDSKTAAKSIGGSVKCERYESQQWILTEDGSDAR